MDNPYEVVDALIGRTIVDVRQLTEEEKGAWGWAHNVHGLPPAIVLDNGGLLLAFRDYEANGPGQLKLDLGEQVLNVQDKATIRAFQRGAGNCPRDGLGDKA